MIAFQNFLSKICLYFTNQSFSNTIEILFQQTSESLEVDISQPHHSNAGLYMFECIELELGISLDDNAELYSSPITLYADPFVPSRYLLLRIMHSVRFQQSLSFYVK